MSIIEQVVSTSELQGSGFRQRPGPGLPRMLVTVLRH